MGGEVVFQLVVKRFVDKRYGSTGAIKVALGCIALRHLPTRGHLSALSARPVRAGERLFAVPLLWR